MSVAADRLEELERDRDKARAEAERLKMELEEIKRSLRESVETRNKNFEKLIKAGAEVERLKMERDLWQQIQRDEATINQQLTVRQEPSRLEIAALAMQGFIASSGFIIDIPKNSLEYADALIAAAKESK